MDEQNILETQLILGKQVLEIVLDLLKNDSKAGVVLPLNINDHDFTITIEKEVTDWSDQNDTLSVELKKRVKLRKYR